MTAGTSSCGDCGNATGEQLENCYACLDNVHRLSTELDSLRGVFH
jgi:hypothetical protein